MNHSLEVKKSITISASIQKVWEVMTQPEHIAKFLYGTETITDWQPNSKIVFQGEYEGHQYKDKGIVQVNKANEELSYKYYSGFSGLEDKEENYCLVRYLFENDSEGNCIFTWHQIGYPDAEKREHSESGMDALLQNIKAIAEDQ